MKLIKPIFITFIAIFILLTLYKIVLIYVLNVTTLKSSYIHHSNSIEESKSKDLYVATYKFDSLTSSYNLTDSLIPSKLFIEKEKLIYPHYYFYWGKSEIGSRFTVNGLDFLVLSKLGKFDINCPSATLPNEKENIDSYRKNVYFFFNDLPSEITFVVSNITDNLKMDSLVFKKVN